MLWSESRTPELAQVLGGELALTQKEVQPGQDFMGALQTEAQIPLDPSRVRLLCIVGPLYAVPNQQSHSLSLHLTLGGPQLGSF